MAREYARVRVDVWIDDDFRSLTPPAQHLYFVLLTSPSLSYCGVTDWRAGRLAALSSEWTSDQVRAAAVELTERLYVVPDVDTEEVLIRSFVRHDGLMKEARVAVSMVKAFGSVASNTIRGVLVHELKRLHAEDDTMNGWRTTKGEPGQALTLLTLNAIDPAEVAPDLAHRLGVGLGDGLGQTPGGVWGSVWGSTSPAPTPAPTPSTSDEVDGKTTTAPRKRGRRIPDDFEVTDRMREWADAEGFGHLDLDRLTVEFRDYWASEAGAKAVKVDWVGTWRNRVRAVAERSPSNVRQIHPNGGSTTGRKQQVHLGGERWRDVTGDEVTIGRKTRWVGP